MKNKNYAAYKLSFALLALALSACASTPPVAINNGEQVFGTPDEAVAAYVDAVRNDNKDEMLRILGPDGAKLISSGDPVADKAGRERFLSAYDTAHKIEKDGDNKEVLLIGDEEWPLPIPLEYGAGGWSWDTAAGAQEILDRRIGRNELTVIEICRTYIEAQRDFAAQHKLPDGTAEYAQKFVSSHGKHDGLYWPVQAGQAESPLGPLIAEARAEGYTRAGMHKNHAPYHGYYYKILTQQGPSAIGGEKSYIHHGHMTGGFALLAFPAQYNDSGIMSFIVNQNGFVYEKNIGPDTASIAAQITTYDPDPSWHLNGSVPDVSGTAAN